MPNFTLATIMSEATAMVGSRLELTASRVSFYANMAMLDVAKAAPNTRLESTTTLSALASVSTMPLPTDWMATLALSTISSYDSYGNRRLLEVPTVAIDNASEGTTPNRPNRFSVFGTGINLYPTPASAESLVLRYQKFPADMVNLTDTPSLSTDMHPAVLFKTVEYLFGVTLDAQREALARNRYLSYVQSAAYAEDTQKDRPEEVE